ncbi:hypothetical protein JL09_g6669 [Pichia kudriavzevii]|uniref:Uncharacterized protein n=1 Tax=Pichia kudriavzevii TaxID=4909 RepID=A0A099NKV1_PICKU|nr:hypothetical protein JL09_g6730 [Pichia kudriavzevii]KGK32724.1 hypothetical protein JL09_g6669 [Pichia kudriavzevii]
MLSNPESKVQPLWKVREEGVSALYKGFLPKVLRLGPGGGILLVVFTNCMDFFRGQYYGDKK